MEIVFLNVADVASEYSGVPLTWCLAQRLLDNPVQFIQNSYGQQIQFK